MEKINIKIKKLYPDACIPSKKFDSDAAFDLYAYCPNDIFKIKEDMVWKKIKILK